jgi:putative restriction endonuclease
VIGTIAVTDEGWYRYLLNHPELEEVNFWRPSARRPFVAPAFSPFLFKLRSPHNAVCGFGFFAVYSALPAWLAWEAFGAGNGCTSFEEMQSRLERIRARIGYQHGHDSSYIGCTTIVRPTFFPQAAWVAQPASWPVRTQTDKKYDLQVGEGARVWQECLDVAKSLPTNQAWETSLEELGPGRRYGEPVLVQPRLGQKTFRIAVLDAYGRACAVTEEHSLPALEAGHIQPFAEGGPHTISNGMLLRADLHRLFDRGYLTVTPDLRLEVSSRLRQEYRNGRTYYPLSGSTIRTPAGRGQAPDPELLRWHNDHKFAA